jgi:transposase InsO family protein
MLVELNMVEQRYQAVLEVVRDGATVVDVARRSGVSRQTVHAWLKRYAAGGLTGLADVPSKPDSCPHQMPPEVEAKLLELRREHPGWGPRTLGHELGQAGVVPVPGRSSIYRCLVRHGLITPEARKRKRSDYKRWERSRAMELWQMDIVGGVKLADGSEAKIVSGIDDHSRFIISALVVERATARPTCDALALAMRTYGVPAEILTDNGKVFTGRFGPGTGEVLFDRICRENGIKHRLTRPRSPTTTGKVERWHKTLRAEFLTGKVFADIADAQAQLDAWVEHYNHRRVHQSIGMVPPFERFKLARTEPVKPSVEVPVSETAAGMPPAATRRVAPDGKISFAAVRYKAAVRLAGETVEVVCEQGLVQIHHQGVLIATHARRHDPAKQTASMDRGDIGRRQRPKAASLSAVAVTRKVDTTGHVSYAGAYYKAGAGLKTQSVQVAVVRRKVEISQNGVVIVKHPIKHDRIKEHGALANPGGRPRRTNAAKPIV